MARTQRGARCKNPRTNGSFCKKHWDETQTQKFALNLLKQIPSDKAMAAWEASQMELAIARSVAENESLQKKGEKSAKRIDDRLQALGLKRVCMPRLGACQFEAVVHAAALPMTPLELRLAACNYLEPLANMFVDRLEERFQGRYTSYIAYMRSEASWGDDMTLLACSHLLRRRIAVVTDSSDESSHTLHVEPPEIISKDLWKEPWTITCMLDRHYDSVAPA